MTDISDPNKLIADTRAAFGAAEARQKERDDRINRMLDEYEQGKSARGETERRNAEYAQRRQEQQRRQEALAFLQYAVPEFAAPMRRLREEYAEATEKVESDADLTDEARSRKLRDLSEKHRREAREEVEVVRDRMGSYLSRYRAIARVNDEPADELRYARLEREFMAKVEAGRVPDLEAYWEAIESGDGDLVRIFEVHGPLHIKDGARRQEFAAEVENQRQARLTDEQKLARQRVRELQEKKNDFEMGLRHGTFGDEARKLAGL